MTFRLHRLWQTPNRLSIGQAKVIGGVAILVLALASTGLVLYEGWPRVVHVSALGLVGLTNLVLALGSVLPEARGRWLRDAVVPLSLLMFVALLASVAMHGNGLVGEALLVGMIAGLIALVVMRLAGRR